MVQPLDFLQVVGEHIYPFAVGLVATAVLVYERVEVGAGGHGVGRVASPDVSGSQVNKGSGRTHVLAMEAPKPESA